MSQRRTVIFHMDGNWLKAAWMDQHNGEFDERILLGSESDIANDTRLLELLKASLSWHSGAPDLHIEIQAESIQLHETLLKNERIRPLLSPHVGQEFIRQEFKDWQVNVDAAEKLPRTKGASDNGITAEEGDSNE